MRERRHDSIFSAIAQKLSVSNIQRDSVSISPPYVAVFSVNEIFVRHIRILTASDTAAPNVAEFSEKIKSDEVIDG